MVKPSSEKKAKKFKMGTSLEFFTQIFLRGGYSKIKHTSILAYTHLFNFIKLLELLLKKSFLLSFMLAVLFQQSSLVKCIIVICKNKQEGRVIINRGTEKYFPKIFWNEWVIIKWCYSAKIPKVTQSPAPLVEYKATIAHKIFETSSSFHVK